MMSRTDNAGRKVSIGMPVFNAQAFIEDAITSILDQTFDDFELVISDNASTDGTERICRAFAAKDDRIAYVRMRGNFGPIFNFNNVFRLTTGEYFKWAAYDDIIRPDFLLRCVEELDQDPSLALVYPKPKGIDAEGNLRDLFALDRNLNVKALDYADANSDHSTYSPEPTTRFKVMMENFWWSDHLYGLIRADALAKTRLHARHYMGDHMLLTELSLYGRFLILPEELFLLRVHPEQTSSAGTLRQRARIAYSGGHARDSVPWLRLAWMYPERVTWYASAVARAPLSKRQKAACYLQIGRTFLWWLGTRAKGLSRRLRRSI